MNTMPRRRPFSLLICILFLGVGLLPAQEEETPEGAAAASAATKLPPIEGELVGPKHLTVFAQMDEMDAKLDSALLATVPQKPTVPAQGNFPEWSIQARKESPSLAGERTRNRDGTYTNS